jgi:Glycosyltransferase WbsX
MERIPKCTQPARCTNHYTISSNDYRSINATATQVRKMQNPKIIAFHLPQFHRIPENDQWWGEGFTEWTNVKKAQSLYRNHNQPRVPLGGRYYNLLDPATQDWQANLAREYGIHGFCYYHYWFNGKQLLEKPVEQLLQRGQPDFPFCLSWANEPWTRAWDGGEKHVLMPQAYGGPEEWRQHIHYLINIFRDPRYIRVDDKPMFLIYRSVSIRHLQPMLELWRNELLAAGFAGLHVVSMANTFGPDPRVHVFDGYAEFEPMWTIKTFRSSNLRREKRAKRRASLLRRLFGYVLHADHSYDYSALWKSMTSRDLPPNHYPGAFADWDNSPRRGLDRGLIMRNFDKQAFAKGITGQIQKARETGAEFLFFNAWNEWAEGTYLEPDERYGLFFLETIRDALKSAANNPEDSST